MKKVNPELIDADNPEWTPSMLSEAKPFSELPASLRAKLSKNQEKIATTISLSPDVLNAFRNASPDWQTQIDAALRDWLCNHADSLPIDGKL